MSEITQYNSALEGKNTDNLTSTATSNPRQPNTLLKKMRQIYLLQLIQTSGNAFHEYTTNKPRGIHAMHIRYLKLG